MPEAFEGFAEEILAEVNAITQEVLKAFTPKLDQDTLRAEFEQAKGTREGLDAFTQKYGEDMFIKQLALALRRQRIQEIAQ